MTASTTDTPTRVGSAVSGARAGLIGVLASRRGRLGLLALVAVSAAVVVVVVLLSAASVEPPATGAAKVVPRDALAYVHFSTDRKRPAVRSALGVARRFPTFPLLSAPNLEVPLANLFPAPSKGGGQVPQFTAHQVAGVTAHQITLAPGLNLAYAVFRNLIVVSTSLEGIGAIAHHSHSIADQNAYHQTLSDQPRPVTSLVFFDFSQLLRLAERTGLTRSARYAALQPDLVRIRAVGLETTRGCADSTAEITLQIR